MLPRTPPSVSVWAAPRSIWRRLRFGFSPSGGWSWLTATSLARQLVELGLVELGVELLHVPLLVDDHVEGELLHAVGLDRLALVVEAAGELVLVPVDEVGHGVRVLLVVDRDEDDLVLLGVRELRELGERGLAGRAPGRPELDEDDLPLEVGELELLRVLPAADGQLGGRFALGR